MSTAVLDVPAPAVARRRLRGTGTVLVWELEKLSAQFRVRLAFAVCFAGPLLFALALRFTDTVPSDTLFGRWVKDSGFAVPLVVLGFAGSWALPLLVSLVAGDIFAAEDHHGTWKTLLTRSRSRSAIYLGKVLAALLYTVAIVAVLAGASTAAGLVLEPDKPLVGLSGTEFAGGHAVALVLASWASVLPTALAYAALGVLVSIWSRNAVAGIVAPTVVGLAMQLLLLVSGIGPARLALLSTGFVDWHGLFAYPSFTGPMVTGGEVSAVYLVVLLVASWALLHRRNVTGA